MVAWTAPTTGGNASHGWDGPHYILYDGNRPTVRPTDPETKRWANITMFEGTSIAATPNLQGNGAHWAQSYSGVDVAPRASNASIQEHSLGELL